MSIKDSVLKFMRPIIAPYSTPRGAAAGILGLINPAAGALVRYGPDILSAMGAASSDRGAEQSGSRSRSRGMSGMMPLSGGSGRGYGVGGSGGLPLSDLTQYFQRERRDAGTPYMNRGGEVMMMKRPEEGMVQDMRFRGPEEMAGINPPMPRIPRRPPPMQPPPTDPYQGLAPDNTEAMRAAMQEYGGSASPYAGFAEYFSRPVFDREGSAPVSQNEMTSVMDQLAEMRALLDARQGGTDAPAMAEQVVETPINSTGGATPLAQRIAELMANRGMTEAQAQANQMAAVRMGADLNNDGAVTNAEFAEYQRSQEPTRSIMPVGDPVPFVPPSTGNLFGSGFLSGLNTDAIQAAIEKFRAAQAADSAAPTVTDTTQGRLSPTVPLNPDGSLPDGTYYNPAVPGVAFVIPGGVADTSGGGTTTSEQGAASDLQSRIQKLIARAGGRGAMFPNIDLSQLQDQIAAFRAGQGATAPGLTAIPPINLPDSGGLSARIPASRK